MDRFKQFANSWKTVGVTSRVKWQQSNTIDRLNSQLIKALVEKYGEEVMAIISDITFEIGLEDGKKICENLNLESGTTKGCVMPLETVSLLSGIDSEVCGSGKDQRSTSIRIRGCMFSGMFDGMNPDIKSRACESYSLGLVRAVNDKAELKVSRKCCATNKFCEFVVSLR
ncbi:hypothetical protein CUJ83_05200 [Methanocella sp. CWC-04]|uniref:Uncharacterized protein n=1 Tax=Methanooceanicella nereidis TaxID=2052831 RepID=A0AAP2RD09_9EURY|nr:hypothetical protein [Methanocella sp. CWC-04]MCD1294395.1 hypothetical protein [Methanocella sp. CWC-04]